MLWTILMARTIEVPFCFLANWKKGFHHALEDDDEDDIAYNDYENNIKTARQQQQRKQNAPSRK
jgi:hypothetical protein